MEKVLGLVIKQLPFKEKEKIITLFTKEHGLCQCIAKNLSMKNLHKINLTTPLCLGYFYLVGKQGKLKTLTDGSILDMHFALRSDLIKLKYAIKMLKLMEHSQTDEYDSYRLFQLIRVYIKQLTITSNPSSIYLSFFLKFLKHEGFLNQISYCSGCHCDDIAYFQDGETYCNKCAPSHAYEIEPTTLKIMQTALLSKQFEEIEALSIQQEMADYIEKIFSNLIL